LFRILAAAVPAVVIGGLVPPAPESARAQPAAAHRSDLAEFERWYYDIGNDPLPHIDPKNYGYLPPSYEAPWAYHPLYSRDPYPPPAGYGPGRVVPETPAFGTYTDGYDDDDWYFDYYAEPEEVDQYKAAHHPELQWYGW
jgi:hypothetical protein